MSKLAQTASHASGPRLTSVHRTGPRFDRLLIGERLVGAGNVPTPTPDAPLIVSVSELRDFLDCRLKWALRYQQKIEPIQGSVNLGIGSLVHKVTEVWYGMAPIKRTTKRMAKIVRGIVRTTTLKQLSTEDKELIEAMSIGYAHWSADESVERSDAQLGVGVTLPEREFLYPLTKDRSVLLRGYGDTLFEPQHVRKTLGLFEFKTAAQIRMSRFEYSIQVGGYLSWMRWEFKKQYKRYLVYPTVLRKQMPGPRVKADLFARDEIEFSADECALWTEDARRTALDMLDAAIYAHRKESCEWMCDYQAPCLLRAVPEDFAHVLKTEYKPKEWTR